MTTLNPHRSPVSPVASAATAHLKRPLKLRSKSAPPLPPAALPTHSPHASRGSREVRQADFVFARSFLRAAVAGHVGDRISAEVRANDARFGPPGPIGGALAPMKIFEKRRGLAAWRNTTDGLTAIMAHVALASAGQLYGFHLKFSDGVQREVLNSDGAKDWLRETMSAYLERALGRPVGFIFRFEISDAGDRCVGLVGEIGCAKAEYKTLHGVLHQLDRAIQTRFSHAGLGTTGGSDFDSTVYSLAKDPTIVLRKFFEDGRVSPLRNSATIMDRDSNRNAKSLFSTIRITVKIGSIATEVH